MEKSKDSKKNILVTGGAGFIGSHLCERLIKDNYGVVCLDNFNDFLYDPKIKEDNINEIKKYPRLRLIKGDILDSKLLDKVFSKYKIERIIHLAALAGVRSSLLSPGDYVDNDIKGTVNLLEKAKENKVKQFIFASSSSVYGMNKKVPFSEKDDVSLQVSPYAAAKRAAEIYCQTYYYLYKIPTVILRFFTVYGPRQRPEMAIHKFTRLMKNDKSIPVYGKGNSSRDYTYIDDIIEGIIKSMKIKSGIEIFNLGNSKTIRLKELIKIIGKNLKAVPKLKELPFQQGDVPITFADISKSKKVLGWSPEISINEGVKKFIKWYNEKEEFLNKLN
jgi:UDP-glucuronate 4-epimerase